MRKVGVASSLLVVASLIFIAIGYKGGGSQSPGAEDRRAGPADVPTAQAEPDKETARMRSMEAAAGGRVGIEGIAPQAAAAAPSAVSTKPSPAVYHSEYIDPETYPGHGFPGAPRHTGAYLDPEAVDPPFTSTRPENHVGTYMDPDDVVSVRSEYREPVHRGEYLDPSQQPYIGDSFQDKHVGEYLDPEGN